MTTANQPTQFETGSSQKEGPVECLGRTFANDAVRYAHFIELLRQKLQEPAFQQSKGFPIGTEEDILALSNPPYHTACPNPFIEDFVKTCARPFDPESDDYHRTPLAVDISLGENDLIYQAHRYVSKVPYQAVVQAILHYTNPGDVVLDGFAGSGTVGVAAHLCAQPSSGLKQAIESEWEVAGMPAPQWGLRRTILNDLSPIAGFISANYNLPLNADEFAQVARRIIEETRQQLGWMYETLPADSQTRRQINYTVWSELFICPDCDEEIDFFDQALNTQTEQVMRTFNCPHCKVELNRRKLKRSYESYFDPVLGKTTQRIKRRPALINYVVERRRSEKLPDKNDLAILSQVESLFPWPMLPMCEMPVLSQSSQQARISNLKITHIHQFFLPKVAYTLGIVWQKIRAVDNIRLRHMLMFWFDNLLPRLSLQNRYSGDGRSSIFPHAYYVPPLISEMNPFKVFEGSIQRLAKTFADYRPILGNTIIGTGSSSQLNSIPDNTIDYIFTDPPVFDHLYYSDLNFMVESWYKVWTNIEAEAVVVNQAHTEGLLDYQRLMTDCFKEYYRTLKPNHWLTVVFPSARAYIWKLIRETMVAAGFVIAGAYGMTDRQRSYLKIDSTAVRQSVVISAYKPSLDLEKSLVKHGGSEKMVWEFVMNHLKQLPVCIRLDDNTISVVDERLDYNLFESAQNFLTQRGLVFPLSIREFYAKLASRLPARDDMYFQSGQVTEYDRQRLEAKDVLKPALQIIDEARAISWLQSQLFREPQTTQEIRSNFRNIETWIEEEKLDSLLAQNFHYYQNRWRLPEPDELKELENQRRNILLEEFGKLRSSKSRIEHPSQIEAVRVGFQQALKDREYEIIIGVQSRIPQSILFEYPDLVLLADLSTVGFEIDTKLY